MPVYYPQGIMTMRVRLEDFGQTNPKLQELQVFTVVCRRIRVQLNSYLEADTFDAEIDFKNFPFDPRTIRAAGVTVHVEDRERIFQTNNALNLLEPKKESIIFQGFMDEDRIELSDDKRTVIIEGRDFTSILIDKEFVGELVVTKPLDQVIQGLLDANEDTKELKVDNKTGGDLPTLSQFYGTKSSEGGKKNSRRKKTYWDHIQDMVEQAGLIAYISLDKLVISKPRTLYDKKKAKKFVYGENVKSLEFQRKLGRQKGFNIRVISLDVENKKVIEALIPEQATEEWAKDINIARNRITIPVVKPDGTVEDKEKDAPFMTFRIPNVTSSSQLVSIGEKIFEETSRQQIEGRLTTKDMRIADDVNDFFDSTQFRVGTPIEILIDQGDMKGLPDIKTGTKEKDQIAITKFLIGNGYKPVLAEAIALSVTNFTSPFFTKAVEFSLDQDNGWTMDLDFINFIDLPKSLADRTSSA